MRFWWTYFTWFIFAATCNASDLIIINDYDPGQCDQTNHGDQVLVLDREDREQILTCSKNDGVYQWTTAGGDNPVGELFSPGYDCSKILDEKPEAKDGLYWIDLGGYNAKQVYCDMTTDGGGYILIGRKNNSVTWTLPSNDLTVEPYGDPHWASNLGDTPVRDFRVQIATADDLKQTKAHWSFRMNSERPLNNLMVDDKGCSADKPGIGDIAYVKDIETKTIVTTGYRCSVFGKYRYPVPGFGWHQINSCLNQPCESGYAYWEHPIAGGIKVDAHGAFSFSASGTHSGVKDDATAFIGCSPNGICCGCFGPDGGTDNYCRPNCTAINGGTVVEHHTYTWFWVRTSLPKRVWNKCMDYKVRNSNGEMVSYRLLDGDTIPEKGQCPKNGALLNDGIVVVPDNSTAENVPEVPGLLEYRKDTKKLYLRANETWREIAPEKKILAKTSEIVTSKYKIIEQKLHEQNQTILEKTSEMIGSNIEVIEQKLHEQNQTILEKTSEMIGSNIKVIEQKLREQNQTILEKTSEMVGSKINVIEQKLHEQNQTVNKFYKNDIAQLKVQLETEVAEMKHIIENLNNTLYNLKQPDVIFFESSILFGELSFGMLLKSWIGGNFIAKLCWRASRDGWSASTFHSNCDNKKPTVTIVKVDQYIFGGYATASWGGSGYGQAPGSFIFSLRNKENLPPFKAPLKSNSSPYAIYCSTNYGPTFGAGFDLCISNNAASNSGSHTSFGFYYQVPSGVSSSNTILAGTRNFSPSEVEVFYLV